MGPTPRVGTPRHEELPDDLKVSAHEDARLANEVLVPQESRVQLGRAPDEVRLLLEKALHQS
jgi:hypothetical protein